MRPAGSSGFALPRSGRNDPVNECSDEPGQLDVLKSVSIPDQEVAHPKTGRPAA
jgi:hypothetical protein